MKSKSLARVILGHIASLCDLGKSTSPQLGRTLCPYITVQPEKP